MNIKGRVKTGRLRANIFLAVIWLGLQDVRGIASRRGKEQGTNRTSS